MELLRRRTRPGRGKLCHYAGILLMDRAGWRDWILMYIGFWGAEGQPIPF